MKKIIQISQLHKVLFGLVLISSLASFAQVQEEFTARFNQTVKGDVTMIANNMLSRTATQDYNGGNGNHDFTDNVYVDIDGNTGIGASTFNSSNATFSNPEPALACLSIKKAYLYWAAADREQNDGSDNQPSWNFNDVKLMLPGQTNYTTLTADEVIYRGRDFHFSNDPYICVKDITSDVLNATTPYGRYQVANVEAKTGSLIAHPNGNTGTSGGWQIVFIYESPILPSKNISLFDGYAHVRNGVSGVDKDFDISFNGFQTIPIGPVNSKIVIGSLEGDQDLSGDRLQIRNVVNNFVDISAPQRSSSNFFNSRITVGNSNFTDRVPASLNTLGFDAAVFELDNGGAFNTIIGNNQTSATLRLTSNQETYGLYLLGLSVDVWAPDLNPIEMTLNSGMNPTNPGDDLGFNFDILNTGNDNAVNLEITTTLPPQVEYTGSDNLPSGVTSNYNPSTGELTFLIANGLANIGSPELNIDLNLTVKDECYFLEDSCDLSFDIQFVATYNGVLNPNLQTTLSSATLDSCNVGIQDPSTINVNQPAEAVWVNPANDLDRIINCDDTDALNDALALEPSTDKCDFTFTTTRGSFVPDTDCATTGTYTNTWTFTDACGRTSPEYVQLITIGNPNGPVFNETLPADITVQCDSVPDAETLTASVSCGTVTISYNETRANGTCAYDYTLTRTWTATDNCNNSTIHTQTITVVDTNNPTLNLPDDVTVECNDSTDPADTGNATGTDSCGDVTVTFSDTFDADCGNTGTITRTWTATDECGNSISEVQTITIVDTTPPALTIPSDITLECDSALPVENTVATDDCGDVTITFSDSAVETCGNTEVITRTWTATDDCGNTASDEQTITIVDTTAPTLIIPSDSIVECSESTDPITTGSATASDNCGDVTVTFTDSSVSTCGNSETITRTWTATDDCGNTSSGIQTITVEDNTAPTFTVPNDITIECDQDPNDLSITGDVTDEADTCSSGSLEATFADSVASGNCANESIITRTWTLIDDCDNETTLVQTITVEDNTAPTFTVPADITVECDVDVNDLSLTGDVTDEADNCSTGLEATFTDSVASGNCANESIITRTWTLIDDCDNETTFVQTITVEDNTAPTFTVPANISVECDVDVNDLSLTGDVTDEADNCSTGLQATFADSVASGNCANESIITRTWTLIDDCDNETTLVQTITVEDNTAPTFTVPANITVECDVDVNDLSLTGDVTDEADNCSTGLEATFADSVASGNCANESIITRTWTLIDDCDNETTFVQTITVEDNTAPVLTIPADAVVECTDSTNPSATGSATATDTCGNTTVTYIDSAVSACGNTETITRTWTATDDCGNTTSDTQTISVVDTVAPDLTNCSLENSVLECSDTNNETLADAWNAANIATLEACATDTCDDDLTGQVTSDYDFNNLNTTCGPCGTINVTYTITDDCGNDSSITVTLTFDDGTIPDLSNCSVTDQAIECDGINNETLANDWNAANISALETCADDLGVTVTSNYAFTNLVSTCGQAGTIAVTYTITDDCGNATTLNATLTIEDTTPPTFTVPNDITIECDQDSNDLAITGDVTDEADTCSSSNLEATFTDSVASGNCANESIITRTWTLIDDCGNETEFNQTITVEDNTAPTFTVPANITVECDVDVNDLSLTGDVTDEADNCSTGLQATFADSVASGNCANESIITRTWTLIDDCDNETTLVQTITVEDNTAPTFTVPANITVECDVDVNDLSLTGDVTDEADNCSTGLQATFADSVASGNCANESIITRTWTLIDDCDNETTLVQTITVEDNTAPTFTVPANISVECDVDVNDLSLTGDVTDEADNCSTGLQATFADSVASGNCANESIITRTWTLIDDCDNETTLVQTITVEDNTAPTFTVPADITVECDVDVNDLSLTGDVTDEADNCSTGLQATFADSVASGNCANESIITRTWTLIDDCDNETTLVQTITVEDNTAPTFTVPANISVECDVDVNDLSLTGDVTDEADNCSTGLEATFADSVASGNCANESIITRTWTLIDDCDNETTLVQTITVEDNTAPTFTVPADITVECDVDVNDLSLTGDVTDEADNCSTGLQATFADSVASGNCVNESIITRTWTLIDDCGNETTLVQTITVEDNTAPTFTVPANITVECDVDVNDLSLTGDVTDEADNCSTGLEATFADSVASGNCANESIITRTWTLIDDCDNETTFVQTITVEDNTAPVLTMPTDAIVECTDSTNPSATGSATATDTCGNTTVTYIDSAVSACGNTETITRTWTATDDCGNTTSDTQTISVVDTVAPDLTNCSVENTVLECSDTDNETLADAWNAANIATLEACATDTCDDDLTGQVTSDYDFNNLNTTCGPCGTINVTYTITDDCGNDSSITVTLTFDDGTIPDLSNCSVTDQAIECDGINNETLANDWNAANISALETCADDLGVTVTSNYAFTNLVSTCGQAGTIAVIYTITDDCGNATTLNATLTIEDTTPPTFTVPNDITIECDQDSNDLAITGDVTDEADTCSSSNLEATFTDSVASGNCANESIITRTWTLIDDCGNETEFNQTITVEDNTAPTFTVPANITVECDVDVNDLSLTGDVTDEADNCSTGLQATFADSVASGNCANESIITRTWTLIDDCDNETTFVQTITVEDNTAPTFTVPANISVECDVDVNDLSLTGDVTDEADNCSTGLEATFTDSVASGNCANESIITRTWTLIDDCDNETTLVQTITVEDNTAPTFTVPANITVECDVDVNDLSLTGDVTDEADNCSTGLEATFADSVASGNCANESIITRTWTLIDDCDNETTFVQTITVEDNTAPVLTIPADAVVECTDSTNPSATGSATATDTCGNTTVTYIDSAVSACGNTETITRTWTATDDCGNTTSDTQTISVVDTVAPDLTNCSLENSVLECSDTNNETLADAWNAANIATLEACATDTCDDDLTGQVTSDYDFNNLNTTCGPCGTINVTYTITDDCGNDSSITVTLTFDDGTIPDLSNCSVTDQAIECDGINNETLANDWNAANISALETCADDLGVTVTSNYAFTNLVSTCGQAGTIAVIYTITDDCGNATTLNATLTIEDTTPPTFTVPNDITIECDQDSNDLAITGDVTDEADTCSSSNLEATFTDSVASGNCANESIITRTWTLIDDCGNETEFNQTITVEDNTAPTFTVPANITVECDVDVNDLSLTGDVTDEADNCSTGLQATFADSVASGNCANESIITRTWTLIDDCDNETTLVQTITVEDNTAPTFTVPANITVECDVDVNDLSLTGDVTDEADNCSTGLQATFADSVASGNCANESIITRTWTLIDDCDNETTLVQTITVEDNTAPTFTVPANISVECDVDVNDLSLTGDVTDEADNCSTGLQATFADSVASGNCANESIITRTWTLIDDCDNETTLVQTITVEDNTAPTFTVPADITVECDVDVNDLSLTGDVTDEADNCSTGLQATFADSVASGNCANESIITRTWTLIDDCDNETTLVQTITVEDNTAPTFTVPANISVECDVDVNDLSLTGDVTDEADNCSTGLEATFADSVASGNCANESIITRTWTLIDDCDNETTLVQTITVEDNTAPTFTVPANITVECDVDVNNLVLTGDVTDEADNCSTGLEATFADSVASGNCANESIITRTWTLIDDCGNETEFNQTITVEDNTAPTFTVPANITVECDVDVNNLVLTGDVTDEADNCTTGLEATFTDSVASGNCANESIITRTWKLVDECGNETEFNQTITVEDNSAPTFTVPADITVECDVDVNDLTITGDVTDEADNCSTGLEASYEDVSIAGNCPTLSIITRTWKLTDECGNETEFDQIITVQDTTAPFLSPTSNLEDLFVVCNDIPDVPNLVFEDACSSNMTVTFTENSTSDGTEQDYIIIREWLVEDECGNAELFTQTITVGVQNEIEVLEIDGLCILEDFNFDLFDVLSGNFDTDGVWTVTMGDATLDGSFFNPSSLLDVNDEYTDADLGDYTFTYTVGGICPSETQVTININDDCRVLPCGEEDLIISKAVTVNNDGINDFFTVGGIEECGFVIELQIFNRWGAKIYDNSNYQNNWSGQASGASIGNSGFVPTGTYYYIINLKNSGLRPITGPIYVSTN